MQVLRRVRVQPVADREAALRRIGGSASLQPAECALRTIAVTRKNFLFLGAEAGGDRAAILCTVPLRRGGPLLAETSEGLPQWGSRGLDQSLEGLIQLQDQKDCSCYRQ